MNVLLGPGVDIARNPLNGRNFEYAGEDPYLAGQAAAGVVQGIQSQHVIATVKHYALNDQETNRTTDSSDADERTMQEIDLPAFDAAVKAGVGSVMCSYNRINSVYACENPYLLHSVLDDQFAFSGFVMSDWGANHSTVASANAGLDMEMPGGVGTSPEYCGPALQTAVQSGQVSMAILNQMVRPDPLHDVPPRPVRPRARRGRPGRRDSRHELRQPRHGDQRGRGGNACCSRTPAACCR